MGEVSVSPDNAAAKSISKLPLVEQAKGTIPAEQEKALASMLEETVKDDPDKAILQLANGNNLPGGLETRSDSHSIIQSNTIEEQKINLFLAVNQIVTQFRKKNMPKSRQNHFTTRMD